MKQKITVCIMVLLYSSIAGTTTGSNTALSQSTVLITYPNGANSVLLGAELIAGFTLTSVSTSLAWGSLFSISGPITMNGGTITLSKDFIMQGGATLVNGGIFNCAGFNVIFPPNISAFVIGTSASTFNGGTVIFQTPVTLNTTLIFQGTSTLDAQGNVINCANGGAISVSSGGALLIKNAVLQGVSGTQLSCADNTATLSLQNVSIVQNGNFTFNQGLLNIVNDVEFTGSSVFAFKSTNSLNITSFAELFFDEGSTFSYDTSNASLLKFSDATSTLFLNGATLYATGTGINLTKGTLNINSNSFFASTGTLGVTIGSCVAANDCAVNLFDKAQLTVSQGILNYKNINASSFNMFNSNVALLFGANTTLNVYKNLAGQGSVTFGNNVTLGTSPGASLTISSLQQGAISFATLSSC